MGWVGKVRTALLAGCLAAGLAAGWAESPGRAEAPALEMGTRTGTVDTVTLITGDRVVVRRGVGTEVNVRPGRGRERVDFQISRVDGRVHVLPSDAAALVAAKVLDRQLFDVTTLIEDHYDDTRSDELSVIVTHPRGFRTAGAATLEAAGGDVVRDLSAVSGSAVRVAKQNAGTFWNGLLSGDKLGWKAGSRIEKVWLDARIEPTLDQSVRQIGAPAAWEAGYTGAGVRVAVLDGGVDATHPDLAGGVVEQASFVEGMALEDVDGHGTHVASTIAGTGAASDGRYRGVAHGAELLSGKVCAESECSWSAIIAGMQWAVDQQAKVVNLSLGGADSEELDPVEEAVNTLTAQSGTLFVVAAGNDGEFGPGTVSSPGSADAALTVGAVDKRDALAAFSGRGPRVGDHAIKPDLTAPGVDIVAARAKDTQVGAPVGDHYVRASGTSMATPHVAGAAALLAQQHPGWTARELKAVLMGSANPSATSTAFEQGAGRTDVAQATIQSVFAEPASLSYGMQRWPHEDDVPVTKDLTYNNTGTSKLALTLDGTLFGPDGEPAPDGALTLSTNRLTVPAGGTATVRVTVSTRNDRPVGTYSGTIVATGGGQTGRTPLAVEKESEHYVLTVRHVARNGEPSPVAAGTVFGITGDVFVLYGTDTGVLEVRLPAGRYRLGAWNLEENHDSSIVVAPNVVLDRDRELVLDARTAMPIRISVPTQSARPVNVGTTHVTHNVFGDALTETVQLDSFDNLFVGQSGPNADPDEFNSSVYAFMADPGPQGTFADSPYLYGLHFPQPAGSFLTGFDKIVGHRELATVTSVLHTDFGHTGAVLDPTFTPEFAPGTPDGEPGLLIGTEDRLVYGLPGKVLQYLSVDGTQWNRTLRPGAPGESSWEPRTSQWALDGQLRRGRSHDVINGAPFGPAFHQFGSRSSAARLGDRIRFNVSLHSDSAGHVSRSDLTNVRATLHRDGELVAEETESDGFLDAPGQPAAEAVYRVAMSSTRDAEVSRYASSVEAAWTFRSKSARALTWEPLPLSVLRFGADTDELGRVRSGTSKLTVTLQPNPGSTTKPKSVLAEASFDDGVTWQRVALTRVSDRHWVTQVRAPEGTAFVSLRGQAVDSNGNIAEQKVLRAFGVR